jgi:glycosyltransferase involved in cell wall biosynthesis
MQIAYVTTFDATSITSWSGTAYYIAKALEKQSFSIDYIGPLTEYWPMVFKAKELIYRIVLRKTHHRIREPRVLRSYAKQVSHRLKQMEADIVFAALPAPVCYLECQQPIAFWSDAVFAGLLNFYPRFTNLSKETIRNGHQMAQSALSRCRLAIYSSNWAAKTVLGHYQVDSSKVHVVPYGANVNCDRTWEEVANLAKSRSRNRCKLLFVGVDWYRKGGDTAYKVAKCLNEQGLETELTVLGCEPNIDEPIPDFVQPLGFVSKSTASGRGLIDRAIAESHFLILPSQADCTPIVIPEANSFGVPCLTTDVGGIPTMVKDDLNGRTFPANSDFTEYANYVLDKLSNYAQYQQMALNAFNEYETRLNWDVAGRAVKKLLDEFC